MRYEVPQFIDIETKMFGPLTWRQAFYVVGSAGMAYVAFTVLGETPFIIKALLAGILISIGPAFAFIKINKRKLSFFLGSMIIYLWKPKRYVWKKNDKKKIIREKMHLMNQKEMNEKMDNMSNVQNVNRNKLKELALSLDLDTDEMQY